MRSLNNALETLMRQIAVVILLIGISSEATAQTSVRITGTYSDMSYVEEAGDVVGKEIRIVGTAGGYEAALQFAEGVPHGLIVVMVEASGNKITFSIPEPSDYAGRFTGTIQNGVLKGEFRYESGETEIVKLPRLKSYWD
jgi:hypothetical protein